jgi:hypothetical protein
LSGSETHHPSECRRRKAMGFTSFNPSYGLNALNPFSAATLNTLY